jgi:hypothetical protein
MTLTNSGILTILGNLSAGDISGTKLSINGKQAVNGPAFRVFYNDTITPIEIDNVTVTKVPFQSEVFDIDNLFDITTNYIFTPNVAGYYQFNSTVTFNSIVSLSTTSFISLYKNDVEISRAFNNPNVDATTNNWSLIFSDIAFANGTTDFFDIRVFYNTSSFSSTRQLLNGSVHTFFSGAMIRGANPS